MSDAPAARPPDAPHAFRHLELIEAEVARHRQNAFRTRVAALVAFGGFVALHGARSQPRYMFVAPALAVGAWLLDAHAEYHARCLRWLAAAVRGDAAPARPRCPSTPRPSPNASRGARRSCGRRARPSSCPS